MLQIILESNFYWLKKNFFNSSFVSDSIMQIFVNMVFFFPLVIVLFLRFEVTGEEKKIKSC